MANVYPELIMTNIQIICTYLMPIVVGLMFVGIIVGLDRAGK